MNVLSSCLQIILLLFCLLDVHPQTFMSVYCTSKLFTPYHHCKILWAYNLPLQHSSATRSFQFVSWRLQEQELLRQQQRQHQHLMRTRKGVSQQQENVNGVTANQRINKVKFGRRIWWGMQRGEHVCQRSDEVKYTKWNTADQSDRACRGARMSVRGATEWNTADQSDGACRGMRMSISGATKWNTADQLDGACRGACMSLRQATCREWCASSQFIIVESFLY